MSMAMVGPGSQFPIANLPKVSHGRGLRIWDQAGRSYIDGSSGPVVYSLGHSHPEVNAAIRRQLDQIAHGYRYTFNSDPLEELTGLISAAAGGSLCHMVFVSGGSEAVESALKIALQYHSATGSPRRRHFISRERSWHGNTLGALSVSHFASRRAPFEGSLLDVTHIEAANEYRPPVGVAASQVAQHAADALDLAIQQRGADTVAAFIFEPIVGTAGGVVPAPPGYARLVRNVCDRHGVLMIADEVICGAGRAGTWRALEHDSVEPDIMAVAKGLGGGYVPLGATIYSDGVAKAIAKVDGRPMTGHTFTGHTLACAAGAAVQRIVARDKLLERVRTGGERLRAAIDTALKGVENIGDIRGRGLLLGIELVANPATKRPFSPAVGLSSLLLSETFSRGLLCLCTPGNVDGVCGDTIIVSPPYISTDEEIDEIADILGRSVRAVLATLSRASWN